MITGVEALEGAQIWGEIVRANYGWTAEEYVREQMMKDLRGTLEMICSNLQQEAT